MSNHFSVPNATRLLPASIPAQAASPQNSLQSPRRLSDLWMSCRDNKSKTFLDGSDNGGTHWINRFSKIGLMQHVAGPGVAYFGI